MKHGYKTTEFWITALSVIATAIMAGLNLLSADQVAIASAVASGLYAISRGLAKRNVVWRDEIVN